MSTEARRSLANTSDFTLIAPPLPHLITVTHHYSVTHTTSPLPLHQCTSTTTILLLHWNHCTFTDLHYGTSHHYAAIAKQTPHPQQQKQQIHHHTSIRHLPLHNHQYHYYHHHIRYYASTHTPPSSSGNKTLSYLSLRWTPLSTIAGVPAYLLPHLYHYTFTSIPASLHLLTTYTLLNFSFKSCPPSTVKTETGQATF